MDVQRISPKDAKRINGNTKIWIMYIVISVLLCFMIVFLLIFVYATYEYEQPITYLDPSGDLVSNFKVIKREGLYLLDRIDKRMPYIKSERTLVLIRTQSSNIFPTYSLCPKLSTLLDKHRNIINCAFLNSTKNETDTKLSFDYNKVLNLDTGNISNKIDTAPDEQKENMYLVMKILQK